MYISISSKIAPIYSHNSRCPSNFSSHFCTSPELVCSPCFPWSPPPSHVLRLHLWKQTGLSHAHISAFPPVSTDRKSCKMELQAEAQGNPTKSKFKCLRNSARVYVVGMKDNWRDFSRLFWESDAEKNLHFQFPPASVRTMQYSAINHTKKQIPANPFFVWKTARVCKIGEIICRLMHVIKWYWLFLT